MGSRLRYLLALIALPALAAEPAGVTVTRTPVGKETEPPKDPGPNAAASDAESYTKTKLTFDKWTDAIARTDVVARRELAAVQGCYKGEPAKAHVKLTIGVDATVRSVVVDKGTDAALVACFESVYKGQRLPAFTSDKTKRDIVLDWTVELGPATAPLAAIDRDLGVGASDFGAPVESLGSSLPSSSTSFVNMYARQLDGDARWFGVPVTTASYGFDKDGAFMMAIFEVSGETGAYAIRQSIKERYGQPKWEGTLRKWYWRGKTVLIDTVDRTASGGMLQVWVVDMARVKAAGLGLVFPGDPIETGNLGPRLPSIFQHQGQTPEGNPSESP